MGRSVRFPRPRRFAVAQIDHVAMVAILGLDELAHQEAAAIRPKKYLIYLDTVSAEAVHMLSAIL